MALALRTLDQHTARRGSLFGAHPDSVRMQEGFDLIAPVLQDKMDAEIGILE